MNFTGVIAKVNPFSLFLRKFLRTLKQKKYPFPVKIWYEQAAPWVTWVGEHCIENPSRTQSVVIE
jgi:hypothetical protein